jgi:hypothetical protein
VQRVLADPAALAFFGKSFGGFAARIKICTLGFGLQ